MKSFDDMPTVRTPEASRTLAKTHPGVLPSPLRNWVGNFNHVRFRGYLSVHFRFGLLSPCLRFAVAVTGHHARLGTWLLARLYQGSHLRLLFSMRLQGATLIKPDMQISRIRLSDKTSRLRPWHVALQARQTNEMQRLVEVRVRISHAPTASDLVLVA